MQQYRYTPKRSEERRNGNNNGLAVLAMGAAIVGVAGIIFLGTYGATQYSGTHKVDYSGANVEWVDYSIKPYGSVSGVAYACDNENPKGLENAILNENDLTTHDVVYAGQAIQIPKECADKLE